MTDLRRHVPPVALHWDAEAPDRQWQVLDGTLVFADVSGFTALTERLSRRGRIGAEEIVETLNRVFSPMLRICVARGGELLKFGGDALLFLFRGDDHAEQACDAAVEMRAGLRESTAVPTSVGRLALSMSVGVHSGDVHLFLVGSPTRELLVLGPAASATADAEQAAQAGEIVVTPPTVARLSPGSTRPRADGALLLRRRRAHHRPSGTSPDPPAGTVALETLFPHELGSHLAAGPPEPEHRLATIAFVRFSGTDRVLDEEGPQVLAERLHRLVTVVEEALLPEGVTLLATDLDSDGGKFFLGSGVPYTREDDEGRMVRALRRVADADLPFPVQLGVNRGHVFAAEVGIAERAAYSAMGDTTNTAARITAKAPHGRLYAHPGVLERARTRFDVEPAGPFPMKGKSAPVLVYRVGEERGTRAAVEDRGLPFVGREREISVARAMLADALGGAGGVLVVDGATGMGKSRLVHEALARSPDAERLVLRAEPYGASSAYRVLRDPLRALLGIERADPDTMGLALVRVVEEVAPGLLPVAPLLADVVQVAVPPTPETDRIDVRFRPDRVADAVTSLLERVVPGPLVVVVEEAHWADGASSHLLERLSTATTGRPWAVVAVRRGPAGGFLPEGATMLTLEPLEEADLRQLIVSATEATPLRPHEIDAIVARAEGNPLFVQEATRLARGAGSVDALPESLQAAMSAQIDVLRPDVRRVLRHLSVLGRSFRREIASASLAEDGLEVDAATVRSLGDVLEEDGPYRLRFRNSLLRDVAYEGLAYRVRTRVHRSAGDVLERMSTDLDADAPTLALHFGRAGDAARTWEYARRAGDIARHNHATAEAATHYAAALEVSRRVPGVTDHDRAELWRRIGDLRELAGMFDGAVEAHGRAAHLFADDPIATAEVLQRRAGVRERAGAFTTALRDVTRARRLLDGVDDDRARAMTVRLDAIAADVRSGQNRPKEAHTWAERAVAGAREIGDHETLVRSLMTLDFADMQMGILDIGDRLREALDICVREGFRSAESVARANLGTLAYFAGDWTAAAEWYRTSRQAALETGNAFGAAETDVNLGELLLNQGRFAEAEAVLAEAVRVLRASGAVTFLALGEMHQARLRLGLGDVTEAEEQATRVHEQVRALGQMTSAMEAALVRADAMTRDGRAEEALEVITSAEREARADAAYSLPRTCIQRARALLALGQFGEADEMVSTGLVAASEQGLPYEEALLLRLRSRVDLHRGNRRRAGEALVRAEETFRRLGVDR